MRAVVHPTVIKAVPDLLLKNDDLIVPIATFASDYVEKGSTRLKKEEDLAGSRRKIRELPPSLPTSDPSDDDNISCKEKKNDTYVVI